MNDFTHDVIVIGSGPAGLSAAITAKKYGLRTLVLDEQAGPGGQIYRNISSVSPAVAKLLGKDYMHGKDLVTHAIAESVEIKYGALVWDVASDLTLTVHQAGQSFQIRAPQLIAATGAMERPSPVPGWTLPGVLTAGAAQIALKSGASVPAGKVVLAGAGPLLLLVACQLLDAGVDVRSIVQTSPRKNIWNSIRYLPSALGAPEYLVKGLGMLMKLRKFGVSIHTAAENLRIEGEEQAEAVVFQSKGREYRYEAKTVLLHHGVVPNTQLSRLMRIDHKWDERQQAWAPNLDEWGETSLAGLRIAGDGAAIGGALAAEPAGALAALGAAKALGVINKVKAEDLANPLRAQLAKQLRIRPFLDELYRPPKWLVEPADETIVCRCEEVTAGQIRDMARVGCQGPNQTKFFSRCGMGPCQGRMCGLTVTQILANETGSSPEQVGAYHVRSPLKPIPLASLAMLVQPGPTDSSN